MSETHEGGCLCGAVRYRTSGTPRRISACSCRACQLRSGGPLGLAVYFDDADIEFLQGELRSVERTSDAGRWVVNEFCPSCGTTVTWTGEFLPGRRAIAAGTFDEPSFWAVPERFVYSRTSPVWLRLDKSIPAFETMPT